MPRVKKTKILEANKERVSNGVIFLKDRYLEFAEMYPDFEAVDGIVTAINFLEWALDDACDVGLLTDDEKDSLRRIVADTVYVNLTGE